MNTQAMRAEFRESLPEIMEGRDPMFAGSVRCKTCAMTFCKAAPKEGRAKTTRCSEPGCKRRFWHIGANGHGENLAKVGVFPDSADGPVSEAVK